MRRGHHNYVWDRVQRDRAVTEQGGICPYCKMKLTRSEATREHVKPRHDGGGNGDENIIAVHKYCNAAKGGLSPSKFKRLISGKGFTSRSDINAIRILRRIDARTQKAVKSILQDLR